MALMHEVEWSNRKECLEAFASSIGEYPPRSPIPEWWEAFEKWYREHPRGRFILRSEAFAYEDCEEDEFELEDGEEG